MSVRPWLDRMNGWVWIGAFILAAVLVSLLVQVVRFLIKRAALVVRLTVDHRGGSICLRSPRPLWWLFGRRLAYDFLLDLPDFDTGRVAYTLAVKVIPTLRKTTEYAIGDMDRWHVKTNFLIPGPRGVMMFDFGYRKCLPRPVDRVFLMAPAGVIRVYLFHPHPHALTMAHRGEERRNAHRGVSELAVPLWHEGVLCLDLDSLRKLETAKKEVREAILVPPKA